MPERTGDSDELPNLYPDDLDRWLKIAGLVWYLARKYAVELKRVEPKSQCSPENPAVITYREEQRMVIAVRWRDRKEDGSGWAKSPISWDILVPLIANGLGVIRGVRYGAEYRTFKDELEKVAWEWLGYEQAN
jgi:hypothetical protein